MKNKDKAELKAEIIRHEIATMEASIQEFTEDAEWNLELAGKEKNEFDRRRKVDQYESSNYHVTVLKEMIAALKTIK